MIIAIKLIIILFVLLYFIFGSHMIYKLGMIFIIKWIFCSLYFTKLVEQLCSELVIHESRTV